MIKPEIGLSTLFCLSESFKKMTECILKVETTHIEIVDEGLHALNKKRVEMLKDLAVSYDLKYTVHTPFADINIASPSKLVLNAVMKRLEKSIIHASALDCQTWIFHPGLKTGISMFYIGKDWTQNMKSVHLLSKFANDCGVEIAIENVPEPYPFLLKGVEDFERFYSEVNEDIGLVLDIGHANINQQIESFLTHFADKIVHMHAHDNYGETDQHLGVGYGNINWQKTVSLIKDISYNGTVVVESIEHAQQSVNELRRLFA